MLHNILLLFLYIFSFIYFCIVEGFLNMCKHFKECCLHGEKSIDQYVATFVQTISKPFLNLGPKREDLKEKTNYYNKILPQIKSI